VKCEPSFEPDPEAPAITSNDISMAMNAYSIAVAPDSSFRKRIMGLLPVSLQHGHKPSGKG
jgi:hypothetical protein